MKRLSKVLLVASLSVVAVFVPGTIVNAQEVATNGDAEINETIVEEADKEQEIDSSEITKVDTSVSVKENKSPEQNSDKLGNCIANNTVAEKKSKQYRSSYSQRKLYNYHGWY